MSPSKTIKPLFAIIVPFKELNDFVFKCIECCLGQSIQRFELVLLPDKPIEKRILEKKFGKNSLKKIKVIATSAELPRGAAASKRNIGINNTSAEFIALVDSDAYPQQQWLESALPLLKDERVGAVGGPNLEPHNIGLFESLAIKTSYLSSTRGGLQNTGKEYKGFPVYNDFPSSNLITKRKLLLQLGGFDEGYATGEDVKLCNLIRKAGKLILFNKETAVHHHNRTTLSAHLPRMRTFARGKIRALRATGEFRLVNLAIASGTVFVFSAPFVILGFPFLWPLYATVFALYAVFIAADCLLHSIRAVHVPLCIPLVFLTHLAYGIGSLQELLSPTR